MATMIIRDDVVWASHIEGGPDPLASDGDLDRME